MAEGTHIPGTPACGEWETLLVDALDGLLNPEEEARFLAHKADCPACAALYDEARKGRQWLEYLSPEPEPPEGLLEKILAVTGPDHPAIASPVAEGMDIVPAFVPPVWQQPGFLARMRSGVQGRLLMTAAMAFFSITLTLNLAGVQLRNVRLSDLRPQALESYMERQLTMASVPIVRYYDHLRFVYEVESKMRELRDQSGRGGHEQRQNSPEPSGQTQPNPGQKPGSNDGGLRADPQLRPGTPMTEPAGNLNGEYLETSLTFPARSAAARGQSRGFMVHRRERSTPWIA